MPNINIKIEEKVYRRKNENLRLLRNVSFVAEESKITVILGESGCGKTTLLRLIVGLDRKFRGSISGIDGQSDVGMIFQDTRLLPWKTVKENIEFGVTVFSETTEIEIERLLQLVHLDGTSDTLPKDLSGGMAQRVALARALVNQPKVLLMDEPFSSLDSLTRNRLQEELLQIVCEKQNTCVFVTHDLDEAVFLADKVVLLSANETNASYSEEIRLSRPRNRLSIDFANERARIGGLLIELTGRTHF